jgi:hypothetical protein
MFSILLFGSYGDDENSMHNVDVGFAIGTSADSKLVHSDFFNDFRDNDFDDRLV